MEANYDEKSIANSSEAVNVNGSRVRNSESKDTSNNNADQINVGENHQVNDNKMDEVDQFLSNTQNIKNNSSFGRTGIEQMPKKIQY